MSFRKSRKNDDKEDKRALLLHSMEIDDNDDNNNDDDYYSQSSSSNDSYEDVDNDYAFNSSLYRWTCRTIIVFGLILIPLSWGYSYFDHRRSRDDDDDDLMTKLNSLPYQWEPDGPYDKCNPGDYFTQIMEKTLSMTTNPDSPELCDILKKVKTKISDDCLVVENFLPHSCFCCCFHASKYSVISMCVEEVFM